jgi:hypothetical protein
MIDQAVWPGCSATSRPRIALGPEVLALVVEAVAVAIDDDAERHAVDPGADAAVIQRRPRIDGHHVGLGRIADPVGLVIVQQMAQQHALVEAGAADQEAVGRPVAAGVLAPGVAQPLAVGFEAAGGQHAAAGRDPFAPAAHRLEVTVLDGHRVHWRFVADVDAEPLGAAVVGIDQGLAAAHEEGIGAGHMQGARQRWLKMHAV